MTIDNQGFQAYNESPVAPVPPQPETTPVMNVTAPKKKSKWWIVVLVVLLLLCCCVLVVGGVVYYLVQSGQYTIDWGTQLPVFLALI